MIYLKDKMNQNKVKEKKAFDIALKTIKKHQLEMNLVDAEYKFDNSKLLFSFTADGRYMITDSYVDGKNYRRVIIYNVCTRKGMIVARFLENRRPGNVPCDLHPKLSHDNNYIVFDTTNSAIIPLFGHL